MFGKDGTEQDSYRNTNKRKVKVHFRGRGTERSEQAKQRQKSGVIFI